MNTNRTALLAGCPSKLLAEMLSRRDWIIIASPQDVKLLANTEHTVDTALTDLMEVFTCFSGGKTPDLVCIQMEEVVTPKDAKEAGIMHMRARRNLVRCSVGQLVLHNGGYVICNSASAEQLLEAMRDKNPNRREEIRPELAIAAKGEIGRALYEANNLPPLKHQEAA